MNNTNNVIDTLKKNDKVTIEYHDGNCYVGYVEHVEEHHLTIHDYVPDVYRTFNREDIIEIARINRNLNNEETIKNGGNETMEENKVSVTKRTVDAEELMEIIKVLEGARQTKEPFVLTSVLQSGEESSQIVTRERFLDFNLSVALEWLYELLDNHGHLDDEGNFK